MKIILTSPNLRTFMCACFFTLSLIGCDNQGSENSAYEQSALHKQPVGKQQLFNLQQVSIFDGPFAHAQQTNVGYLLAMQPDKLLAPYLREAGLEPKVDSYGNWENTGLDGHIGGHYLSALSLAWAATQDTELKRRLDYMLNELQKAQNANGGYLGGIPNGKVMWDEIKQGNIKADLFSLNDRWVPLYNIDKIFHGLRDAYLIANSEQAKTMLLSLGQWMLDVTNNLSDEQIQQMLYSEHGGLNEVFADMSTISGDKAYLELARKFSHKRIIDPLVAHKDELNGLHANTQIPKIIGALKVAQLNNDESWKEAARFFWETVTKQRSVAIGGNSVREHFHDAADFSPMVEDPEGPETCNTYNMIKLSKLLFLQTADTRYLDYYERATYNHILSSQHPEHGGLVYFTSMRPGHYRMYSSVQDSMWCCVGSGIENHSKYGELIYSHSVDNLLVNLFISSTLRWPEKGLKLTLETQFPDSQNVVIKLHQLAEKQMGEFVLNIRKPAWFSHDISMFKNGEKINYVENQGYIQIQQNWQDGDELSFELAAGLSTEQLPDGQNYYAVLYGPVVLATQVQAFDNEELSFVADDSRMGHIASGPVCPPEALPVILGDPETFVSSLKRSDSVQLAFTSTEHFAIGNTPDDQALTKRLIPFFRLHDSRYQIYWPQLNEQAFEQFVDDAKAQAEIEERLRAITVDIITPGEQQPEVEHNFKGQDTRAGVNAGKHWRDASGWFEYELSNHQQRAKRLRITYFKGDVDRRFRIKLNDEILADVSLPVIAEGEEFYQVDYPLTDAMQNATKLVLRFEAKQHSIAGGIYGIRLLSN